MISLHPEQKVVILWVTIASIGISQLFSLGWRRRRRWAGTKRGVNVRQLQPAAVHPPTRGGEMRFENPNLEKASRRGRREDRISRRLLPPPRPPPPLPAANNQWPRKGGDNASTVIWCPHHLCILCKPHLPLILQCECPHVSPHLPRLLPPNNYTRLFPVLQKLTLPYSTNTHDGRLPAQKTCLCLVWNMVENKRSIILSRKTTQRHKKDDMQCSISFHNRKEYFTFMGSLLSKNGKKFKKFSSLSLSLSPHCNLPNSRPFFRLTILRPSQTPIQFNPPPPPPTPKRLLLTSEFLFSLLNRILLPLRDVV